VQTKTAEESDSSILPMNAVTTPEGRDEQWEDSANKTLGTGDRRNDGK
jgi:hypothetical protein